jgi:hypothetical protein
MSARSAGRLSIGQCHVGSSTNRHESPAMCRNIGALAAIASVCAIEKLDSTPSRGSFSHAPPRRTGCVELRHGWATERRCNASRVSPSMPSTPAAMAVQGGGGRRHPSPPATVASWRARSSAPAKSALETPSGKGPVSTKTSSRIRSGSRSATAVTTSPA